jgi:hypothetical protein
VFTVPVVDAHAGIGQVVGKYLKDAYYLAIFERLVPTAEAPKLIDQALRSRVLFLALSFDAKVNAGHWAVIGNRPVSQDVPLPAYKESVGASARVDVVDFSGERRRPASETEAERLPNRTFVAPVRLEKALRAKAGIEPWHEEYTGLAPESGLTTARLFPLPIDS